ncbi:MULTISPECIES: HNH endonuclease [Bacillus cereus group]|uniref:HNH endonuclease n=1 Tax=Bacillus cereus group TaxID=86661 RepID=UPI00397A202F
MEVWKSLEGIVEYGEGYVISNNGVIKRLARTSNIKGGNVAYFKEKILKHTKLRTGYYKVTLTNNGKQKNYQVHRLLALAFIPNPENKPSINHIDGNKGNNTLSNLEWATQSENSQHAYDNNLNSLHGESHYKSKLTEDDVKWIRENYIPRHKEYGCTPLSKKFNVALGCISNIISYKTWKNVK